MERVVQPWNRLPKAVVAPPSQGGGLKAVWRWHLGTQDSGGIGSAGGAAGLDLFQPK